MRASDSIKTISVLCVLLAGFAQAERGVYSSFSSGELGRDIYGRTDALKFYSGARIVENMFVWPHGPVEKRRGTYYVADALAEVSRSTIGITGKEYPTLQALTSGEIPSKPSETADTALVGESNVSNKTDLQNMSGANHYVLTTDIDASGAWTPIANFSGVLDGADYTISNLTVSASGSDSQGMFTFFPNSAEVRDLTFSSCSVTGKDGVGILAGDYGPSTSFGKVSDVNIVDCTVVCRNLGGGLIGSLFQSQGVEIWRCAVSGTTSVTTTTGNDVGGLIGAVTSDVGDTTPNIIVDCSNTSTGIVQGDNAGGLVGSAEGGATATSDELKIHTCYSTAEVKRVQQANDEAAGGLIGYCEKVRVTTSYATGNITATDGSSANALGVGGFIGFDGTDNTVINCYSTGDITAYGTVGRIGGFVGKADMEGSTYTRCYSTGDVTIVVATGNRSYWAVGGFMGSMESAVVSPNGGLVRRCWSTGDITIDLGANQAGDYGCAGAFVGNVKFGSTIIENCYAWGSMTASDGEVAVGFGGFIGGLTDVAGLDVVEDLVILNSYCAQTNTAVGSGLTDQITADPNSGGFAGYVRPDPVRATSWVIDDTNNAEIVCFWDSDTSGLSTSQAGTGHITDWMQTQNNYELAGWNFDTIWQLSAGSQEPTTGTFPIDTAPVRIVSFAAIVGNGRVIEMGDQYFAFYKDGP